MNKNYYCVILAGGIGTRLWPVSRQSVPKQFIDLLGTGETLLQSTYRRFLDFLDPDNIIVVTNKNFAGLVHEQLPQLPAHNLMLEPMRRNTVPPVTWASVEITRRNPNAVMIVTPSDQNITDRNDGKFADEMLQGLRYAYEHPQLLSVGVPTTRPETTYGYIQMAEQQAPNIYKVQTFTEKPQEDFARIFHESGEFLWNTGVFIWSSRVFLKALQGVSGDYAEVLEELKVSYATGQDVHEGIADLYSKLPNMTLEQTVLEKAGNANVMLCHFGWADLGTWGGIYNYGDKDADGNVLINHSRTMLDNCHDCLVRLPEGHVAVLQGLSGYVVVEEGNVIVICKKDDQGAIRRYVTAAQLDLGENYV
ncbi:MAG: mannose-1-phosphate guanylyltransferase [Bacteroidaceae bacterium]|nr:mannose-1-phosphate guanylyltransferase [Bacteroidaceae bacterium]